jgi:hypothetical protein
MHDRIVAGQVGVVEGEQGGLDQFLLNLRGRYGVFRIGRYGQQQRADEGGQNVRSHRVSPSPVVAALLSIAPFARAILDLCDRVLSGRWRLLIQINASVLLLRIVL